MLKNKAIPFIMDYFNCCRRNFFFIALTVNCVIDLNSNAMD